jgi:hypothetical protein
MLFYSLCSYPLHRWFLVKLVNCPAVHMVSSPLQGTYCRVTDFSPFGFVLDTFLKSFLLPYKSSAQGIVY